MSLTAVEIDSLADVSGGANSITVNFDPRYVSLVDYIMTVVSSAADVPVVNYAINQTGCDVYQEVVSAPIGTSSLAISTIRPPGMLVHVTPDFTANAVVVIDNVDTEDLRLNMRIYNFNREMIHRIPAWYPMLLLNR